MTSAVTAGPESNRPPTHREALWIVAAILPTVFMSSLDQTIVAGALPTIGRELGATEHLSWVVAIYLLTLTAATPLFGRLSDIHGRRLVLRAGLLIFMAGGFAAALAPNMTMLIIARAVQGVGAAGLTSQALTVLGDIAPPRQRALLHVFLHRLHDGGRRRPGARRLSRAACVLGLVFCVTAPLGVVSLIWCDRLLRKLPRHEKRRKLDLAGAALIIAASSTSMFVITGGGKTYAWASVEVIGAALVSALAWTAFIHRQFTAPEPLIPLHIVKSKIVLAAIGASAFGWGAVIGLNIYLPLYLQYVHAMTPAQAGLQLMALMITVNLGALMGSIASAKMQSYKLYPVLTNVLCVAAMAWLALRADGITMLEFQLVLVFVGLGFGPMAPIVTLVVQNSVKVSELGAATSTLSFGRGLFAAVLVAALGAVTLQAIGQYGLEHGAPALGPEALAQAVSAFRIMFWLTTASFALSLVSFLLIEEKLLLASNEGREG